MQEFQYHRNIIRREKEYDTIEYVIAGAKSSDIRVSLSGRIISVSFDGNDYTTKFSDKWKISDTITEEDIQVSYKAGVLAITIKKKQGKEKVIPIEEK